MTLRLNKMFQVEMFLMKLKSKTNRHLKESRSLSMKMKKLRKMKMLSKSR